MKSTESELKIWLEWQKKVIKSEWSKGGAANVQASSKASRNNKGK